MTNSTQIKSVLDSLVPEVREGLIASIRDEVVKEIAAKLPGLAGHSAALLTSHAVERRSKGGKRSPEEITALTSKFSAYVKKNPGQRVETIAKTMGVSTKELAVPVQKLFAEKKLRTTGNRRATKYFAK